MTYEDFEVFTHVCRGEGLFCKVKNTITEIIVTRLYVATIFLGHGVAYRDCRPTYVAMGQQVRWIYAISQEEGIPPFLRS